MLLLIDINKSGLPSLFMSETCWHVHCIEDYIVHVVHIYNVLIAKFKINIITDFSQLCGRLVVLVRFRDEFWSVKFIERSFENIWKIERRGFENKEHRPKRDPSKQSLKNRNTTSKQKRKPFFLRHTACLPSSTSQLVLFHHLFCIHFWGGPLPCSLLVGVHFWWGSTSGGGPLLCSLLGGGGSTSMFTSGGSTSMFTFEGGCTSMLTSGGVHFHVHFQGVHFCVHLWGVPCDLSHNALIYHYRMPQCIMSKIHMGPPGV